jgi:hypothetical protein
MRNALLSIVLLVVAAVATAVSSNVAEAFPDKIVYLDGPDDLARLRAANPEHYAQAELIMAAANELCRPQPGATAFAKSKAKEISCTDMLLRTSNPPKRQIKFTLDDTHYIALVAITDNPPRAVPAK